MKYLVTGGAGFIGSNIVSELLRQGQQVVSTNVGAISNFLTNGYNGYLIDAGNVNQLVDAIEEVLSNQEKTHGLIDNAYNTFRQYTWPFLRHKYQDLYCTVSGKELILESMNELPI